MAHGLMAERASSRRLLAETLSPRQPRHSGAPRSGEPGIQKNGACGSSLDSGFALTRAPE
jgi:hypothetical protein